MKIGKVISNVFRKNQPKEFVSIHSETTYGDSYKQLKAAHGVLENYAKSKNVKIDIWDARHALDNDEFVSPVIENDFASKLEIIVTDLKTKKSDWGLASARTDKTHNFKKDRYIMCEIPSDGLQYSRRAESSFEDSFLRQVFRRIDDIVNNIRRSE